MDCAGYRVVTEPTVEPVTASEMRSYLRMDDTSLDTMLESLISSVRSYLEEVTGRLFCSQTIDAQYVDFDDESTSPFLRLPATPAQSITSIYYDSAGAATLLASTQYELTSYELFPRITPAYDVTWPECDEGTVVVRALMGVSAAGPYSRTGCALIKAIVADLFEHPEAGVESAIAQNKTVERLMAGYRTR